MYSKKDHFDNNMQAKGQEMTLNRFMDIVTSFSIQAVILRREVVKLLET